MSANRIFFCGFFVSRFSHDGLQETCHIAHACRSVLCGLPVVRKNKQYTFGKIGKTLRIVDTSSKEIFQGHKSYSPVSAATNVSKIFVFNVEKKKKKRLHGCTELSFVQS